ncbi:hypothetical protein [Alicyclobacillus sp. ALC3]|uniref:hypothetical protein n=1 Tax=Alicyclobacillus sp. ALC3 TaxID=2796143 RepID=UPI002378DE76|nr:hypothetical protein [Alicyclobacillus sp. ALC3]WDL95732.1 hypothetical protein JC200_15335 [Alicyclobacillus sp. ALC3]
MTIYDHQFNANEWYILVGLVIGFAIIFRLPKRFPRKVTWTFFMCGVYSGFFFDHSIGIEPVSFYDVNDRSTFELFDFISFWTYGPVSYLFFYIWDWLRWQFRTLPIYIFAWACIHLSLEWLGWSLGVFHYQHGYTIAYSFPIYLITLSLWSVLYYYYQGLVARRRSL